MSLLFMMVRYAENQKQIGDNVREIIKSERSLQSALLCVGQITNTLARYPLLNSDLTLEIKNLNISSLGDKNYWINNSSYSNYNQKGSEYYNCRVVDFDSCNGGGSSAVTGTGTGGIVEGAHSEQQCTYRAIIEGSNTFNGQEEGNNSRIYVEWKLDEYRLYISKLRLISNFINSLSNL